MSVRAKSRQLGKQPPRYRFFLNPYSEVRFTTCPTCQAKMRQRKLPLVIHVDPLNSVALNKTCRYCPACDLLIAHQDELEAFLAAFFAAHNPEVVGNDYLVIGTLDRPDWQRGTQSPLPIREMVERLHDIIEVLRFELVGGWQRGSNVGRQRQSRGRALGGLPAARPASPHATTWLGRRSPALPG